MVDIKATIAKNISQLRQSKSMTQIELAERLNYSDKAVSKWERGESLPDISVLAEIAEIFGVTLDYLIKAEHPKQEPKCEEPSQPRYHRGFITGISVILVWLIALLAFVLIDIAVRNPSAHWLSFIYAIPVSMIVWLVLNSTWFNKRRNYLIISFLMWSSILAIHLTALVLGFDPWLLYLLGIPGQVIILMWSKIKRREQKQPEELS